MNGNDDVTKFDDRRSSVDSFVSARTDVCSPVFLSENLGLIVIYNSV